MFDPSQHNYFKKLIELVEQGKIPFARFWMMDVYHEDGCRFYRGGYCDDTRNSSCGRRRSRIAGVDSARLPGFQRVE